MERKIGEIFEYNGEWYQCIEGCSCRNCDLEKSDECLNSYDCLNNECRSEKRKDNRPVIFKKLEKVGEQFLYKGKQMQSYRRATDALICNWNNSLLLLEHGDSDIISIEIKQNKEDMARKVKMNHEDRDYLLDRLSEILHDNHYARNEDEICNSLLKYIEEERHDSMGPFDIEAAKAGKPVCTRDGRKARIICFDAKGDFPIVALVETNNIEEVCQYTNNGLFFHLESDDLESDDLERVDDLMMLPEKKEGWILLRKDGYMFDNEEVAKKNCTDEQFVAKVEWEE